VALPQEFSIQENWFTPCLHLGLPQQKSQLACFAN